MLKKRAVEGCTFFLLVLITKAINPPILMPAEAFGKGEN